MSDAEFHRDRERDSKQSDDPKAQVPKSPERTRADRFASELNKHGFAFQERAASETVGVSKGLEVPWRFIASEFPVAVGDRVTHIDLILGQGHRGKRAFLVCECKRANPAVSAWCFAKSPFMGRTHSADYFVFERVRIDMMNGVSAAGVQGDHYTEHYYHIGVPVKEATLRGDDHGSPDRDAIRYAVDQACLGVNGIIEHWGRSIVRSSIAQQCTAYLVPVVITTAKLYTSSVDLKKARLTDGMIDPALIELQEQPWILLQAHVSPRLKHAYHVRQAPDVASGDPLFKALLEEDQTTKAHIELRAVLEREYVRTVPIVNALSIARFLKQFSLYDMRTDAIPDGF